MGRLIRPLVALSAALAALVIASPVAAFDGFGETSADSTYDREIRFDVELTGGTPDRLELLLSTPGSDAAFVVPVEADAADATYVWDTSVDYVTPNTLITYQWRAVDGDDVLESTPSTIRYEDDRPELDWQSAQLGETTVHWYGDAEGQALRFGELAAVGVSQGEALLGTELAGPVDVFVYEDREDFFGVLGPGAREWTGAAAFSELRTIFMWLGGGSQQYLETAMVHEITHIVFHDATDNPYHEPATWVNEGVATWSETGDAAQATAFVADMADDLGLFAFEAISGRFPIGDAEGSLAYAQGAAMVDYIIDRHGPESMARMTAAYRDGASEDEALEAATGVQADELYAAFFAEFGVGVPSPVEPEPIAASNVDRPPAGELDPGGVDGFSPPPAEPAPTDERQPPAADDSAVVIVAVLAAIAIVGAVAVIVARRARAGEAP